MRRRQLSVVGGQSRRQQRPGVAAGHTRPASVRVDCYEAYSSRQQQPPRRRHRQPNDATTTTAGRSADARRF